MGSEHEPPQITKFWCHACSHIVRLTLTTEANTDPICSFCSSTFVEETNTSPSPLDHQDSPLSPGEILHRWIPILENLLNSSDHDALQRKRHRKEMIARLLDVISTVKKHLSSNNNNSSSLKGIAELTFGPQFDRILLYLTQNPPIKHNTNDDVTMMSRVNSLLNYIDGCDRDTDLSYSTVQIDQSSSSDENEINNCCPICLDEFLAGQHVSKVACKHLFHSRCIETWLQMHNSCPVCRFTLPGPTRRCTVQEPDSVRRQQHRRPRFWAQSRWLFCMCFSRGQNGPSSRFGTG